MAQLQSKGAIVTAPETASAGPRRFSSLLGPFTSRPALSRRLNEC